MCVSLLHRHSPRLRDCIMVSLYEGLIYLAAMQLELASAGAILLCARATPFAPIQVQTEALHSLTYLRFCKLVTLLNPV